MADDDRVLRFDCSRTKDWGLARSRISAERPVGRLLIVATASQAELPEAISGRAVELVHSGHVDAMILIVDASDLPSPDPIGPPYEVMGRLRFVWVSSRAPLDWDGASLGRSRLGTSFDDLVTALEAPSVFDETFAVLGGAARSQRSGVAAAGARVRFREGIAWTTVLHLTEPDEPDPDLDAAMENARAMFVSDLAPTPSTERFANHVESVTAAADGLRLPAFTGLRTLRGAVRTANEVVDRLDCELVELARSVEAGWDSQRSTAAHQLRVDKAFGGAVQSSIEAAAGSGASFGALARHVDEMRTSISARDRESALRETTNLLAPIVKLLGSSRARATACAPVLALFCVAGWASGSLLRSELPTLLRWSCFALALLGGFATLAGCAALFQPPLLHTPARGLKGRLIMRFIVGTALFTFSLAATLLLTRVYKVSVASPAAFLGLCVLLVGYLVALRVEFNLVAGRYRLSEVAEALGRAEGEIAYNEARAVTHRSAFRSLDRRLSRLSENLAALDVAERSWRDSLARCSEGPWPDDTQLNVARKQLAYARQQVVGPMLALRGVESAAPGQVEAMLTAALTTPDLTSPQWPDEELSEAIISPWFAHFSRRQELARIVTAPADTIKFGPEGGLRRLNVDGVEIQDGAFAGALRLCHLLDSKA